MEVVEMALICGVYAEQCLNRVHLLDLAGEHCWRGARCTANNSTATVVITPSTALMKNASTHDPKIQATRNTSYLTASKSLNGRKIARMAPILTIFGPNRSQRRNLFFEKFSNASSSSRHRRRRHRRRRRRRRRRLREILGSLY